MNLRPLAFAAALAACVPTINTSYPVGLVRVTSADVSGHVVVTEPDWFTTSLPTQPQVGARVMTFPGVEGALQMKQVRATTRNEYAEVDYCESAYRLNDVEGTLHDMHEQVVHSSGVRIVGDERIQSGDWKGLSMHVLIAPHSELNDSSYAMDFHELVLLRGRRMVFLFAAADQSDARGVADVKSVVDGFRVAG